MKEFKENLPDILLVCAFIFIILFPVYVTAYNEVFPPAQYIRDEIVEEEDKSRQYSTNEVITMAVYQTYHMSCCAECTNLSFPACSESRGVVDAILNHNTVGSKAKLIEKEEVK